MSNKNWNNRFVNKLLSPRGEKTCLPCLGKVVRSRAQIPRIELVWFLELGFLEVVMQEVSRKALPGDFLNSFFFSSNLARSCYLLCIAGVFRRSLCVHFCAVLSVYKDGAVWLYVCCCCCLAGWETVERLRWWQAGLRQRLPPCLADTQSCCNAVS